MKAILVLFFFLACIFSCGTKKTNDSIHGTQTVDDKTKQKMFNLAYIYESTAPYYVVATIKNKNTEEIKEICT